MTSLLSTIIVIAQKIYDSAMTLKSERLKGKMHSTHQKYIFSANQTRLLLLVCTFIVSLFALGNIVAAKQAALTSKLAPAGNVTEIQFLAQDGAESDRFGHSVSVDGDVAILSAPYNDENGNYAGAAYLFRDDGSGWQQEQKITANDGAETDLFGYSVAVSGNFAIVGALGDDDLGTSSGAAYLFRYDGTNWIQEQKITASDGAEADLFGVSVAISGDYAIVGALGDDDLGSSSGSAYLFAYDGSSWVEEQKINASDGAEFDGFGTSVALDGEVILIGAPGDDDNGSNSGAAYLFRDDGVTQSLQQEQKITGSASGDDFGRSVSVKGDYAIVGAPHHDHLATDSGAAYLFGYDGTAWQLVQSKITANDGAESDLFGYSVSLVDEYVVVAAPKQDVNGADSGALYLFAYLATSWTETDKITPFLGAESDLFGYTLSVSGDSLLVGAPAFDDNIAGADSGAAYFYNLSPGEVPDIALSLTSSRETVSMAGSHTTII